MVMKKPKRAFVSSVVYTLLFFFAVGVSSLILWALYLVLLYFHTIQNVLQMSELKSTSKSKSTKQVKCPTIVCASQPLDARERANLLFS